MDENANTISSVRPKKAQCPMPFNKLLYQAGQQSSESQSEISSIGSNWSDIRSIALRLGITNEADLTNERFKIDRQKLETMIKMSVRESSKAAEFFDTVMHQTSTYISWPLHLKLGAKTKKDPHVRVIGRLANVIIAKQKILAILDARGNRVIMKMDISYTDHSYIIGRGGNNIKSVMDRTKTHIHFPDSNRSNPTEKSNQVSLCGTMEGVERARSLIRLSTPLIISFELPIMMPGQMIPDNDTQYVIDIEEKFNIQVIFSTRSKLHSSLVLVKGSEKEAAYVREATQLLINFMCESIANQIHVNLQLEISPHHHNIVKGQNNTQLLNIMEKTKTKIIFPDVDDVNTKPIKKSQVTITGTIDGVYNARQQLIGNLPVALIFDYPDSNIEQDDINMLGNKYGVFIALRQKSRQSTLCIIIKGVEKNVDKVYEARHDLLKLKTPLVKPDIPATYFALKEPITEITYRKSMLAQYPESPLTPGIPMGSYPNNSPFSQLKLLKNNNGQMGLGINTHLTSSAGLNRYQLQQCQQQYMMNPNDMKLFQPSASSIASTSMSSRQNFSPGPGRSSSCGNTSGYNSSFTNSNNSLEQLYPFHQNNMQTPTNSMSMSSQYSPETAQFMSSNQRHINDCGGGSQMFDSGHFASYYDNNMAMRMSEYEAKRLEGYKYMKKLVENEARAPTATWTGLSLSKSSPLPFEPNMSQWTHRNDTNVYKLGTTTSILETTPVHDRHQTTQMKEITALLVHLKLDHYIDTFQMAKIDIERFSKLTADDLILLGITGLGPRKKLLLAINQLKLERDMPSLHQSLGRFSGSAAPGAERRPSFLGW